ncbi:glycosyltransferase family 2 protein [Paracoccaceae bacterium]|nr:glycosyltransferase family 2 protein [Paracoccaceae bacterium]
MKISIIIPTRERAQYLRYSLQTALEIQDKNLEIIVCNNASSDNTEAIVKSFSDPRVQYINTGSRISMRENFNHALKYSSGEYVIFFGDDDGIVPGQFKYLRAMLETHLPDGLSWNRATYGWPIEGYGNKTGGVRFYRHSAFGKPFFYDPKDTNLNALMGCQLSYLMPVTPNIYHGCVSRDYLNKTAPKSGDYFDSAIPDVNFEYRTIMLGGNFLHADHPFTINGYSPASTGGAHKKNTPGSLSNKIGQAFIAENKADPLEDVMDHALTVPLAFFSTLETAIKRMGYVDHVPDYTAWYHYGLSAGKNNSELVPRIKDILTKHAIETGTEEHLMVAQEMKHKTKRTFKERLARLNSQVNSFRVSAAIEDENTILSAVEVYDTVLTEHYGAVIDQSLSRDEAWWLARQRSKSFARQL